MNAKTLTVVGLAAAVLFGAALYLSGGSDAKTADATVGGKLFPELSGRVNDVVEVALVDAGTAFSVRKEGASWGAADKGGYPVDFDKVKALVVGVAEFAVVEPMTKNPEFHAKMGVEDPSGAGATSRRVTLKDGSGKVLADVIVGKAKANQGMTSKPSLYVRRFGEDQVFEVTGSVNVGGDASGWLNRDVSKVESSRVKRAVITHPDGEVLTVSKTEQAQQDFTVEHLPEGKELSWSGVANGIPSALQYMSLDDVQRAEGFDLNGATVTDYECFDGLVVTARSIERDGKTWITLSAHADESLRALPAGPEAPPEEGTDPAAPKKPELKAFDLVQKEADELNAKWSPWVFNVPGYNATNLRKRMKDLLKTEIAEQGGGLEELVEPVDGQDDLDPGHGEAGHVHQEPKQPEDGAAPTPDKPSDGR